MQVRLGPFEQQVVRNFHNPALLREEGGQGAGKLEVDEITLDMARAFAEAVMTANNRDLDEQLPDFDQNFLLAQRLTSVGRTRRKDMPVLATDAQVREFQNRLKDGNLDINRPLAPTTKPSNPWPEGLSGAEAREFVRAGLDDGELSDDTIPVSMVKVRAKDLKPIQRQIYFDKSMGSTAKAGVSKTRAFLASSLAIMSDDNHIIDGHHRWLSALLVDPGMMLKGIRIGLPIKKLLPISLAYGDAIGNSRNL